MKNTTVPRQQTIRVEFDSELPSLEISPRELDVSPGDVVIWQFFGLNRRWYPWIRFLQDSLGRSGTGPLENFSQSSDAVWGTVRGLECAAATTFEYRASARILEGLRQRQASACVSSMVAQFHVHESSSRETETSQKIVDVGLENGRLVVPESERLIEIFGPESIQWSFPAEIFSDPGEPLLPRVQFLAYEPKQGPAPPMDLRLGPFTTLTFGELSVTATGYAQNDPGVYNYRLVVVRESDGEILWASSDDPLVDDRGEPPGNNP